MKIIPKLQKHGIEFWFARDLQQLLEYTKWDNFKKVIHKSKISCEATENEILDHFADVGKMVKIGSGTEREINDIMLTRYACYLIAQNGDPRKEQIAFAQNYFAVQTRKLEVIEKRIKDWEGLQARQKLALSEKELSELIYEQTGIAVSISNYFSSTYTNTNSRPHSYFVHQKAKVYWHL